MRRSKFGSKRGNDAGRLAEDYRQARKTELWIQGEELKKGNQKTHFVCKQPGHLARDCPKKDVPTMSGKGEDATTTSKGEKKKRKEKPLVCYNYGGKGHTSRQCPSKAFYG